MFITPNLANSAKLHPIKWFFLGTIDLDQCSEGLVKNQPFIQIMFKAKKLNHILLNGFFFVRCNKFA